jgi:putative PIN family toxin of toxin-antitoxin system
MGAPQRLATRRVVHDTNVVLSALLFSSGRLAWFRSAWGKGLVVPLVCRETVTELLRVLTYPKFQLSSEERDTLLADYLPYAETVVLADPWPSVPRCRDPKDRVFLALASAAAADALVTGDSDLLSLAPRFELPILSPDRFRELQGGAV